MKLKELSNQQLLFWRLAISVTQVMDYLDQWREGSVWLLSLGKCSERFKVAPQEIHNDDEITDDEIFLIE